MESFFGVYIHMSLCKRECRGVAAATSNMRGMGGGLGFLGGVEWVGHLGNLYVGALS